MKTIIVKRCALAVLVAAVLFTTTPTLANSASATDARADVMYEATDSPWLDSRGSLSDNSRQLVNQIKDSLYHGLNPANYRLDKIVELHERLNDKTLSLSEHRKILVNLKSVLDDSFYKLANHLGSSLVEGADVQPSNFRHSPKINAKSLYQSASAGDMSIDEVFDSIAPSHTDYVQMQNALSNLMHELSVGVGRTAVPATETLKFGDEHEVVRAAKLRLLETKDFDGSSSIDSRFDEVFRDAVVSFQARHHISPTGELNKDTIEAMNRSVTDDITSVVVSLERWRWMPRNLGYQRVIANIPDFRIRMHNGEQKIADMPVVVGKNKHKTPMFSETIKHVVAAPTWTVPASIANKELVPLERKNPGYLQNNNYELLAWKGGKPYVVPFSRVPRSAFNQAHFPYTIRQKAGDDNALGDVKILMPNKYAIYFHDTQAKSLFEKETRAFSHGCVRLGDPMRLASLIMQLDGVSPERTQSFLASKKTKQYDLDQHIDSHIVYFTTFADEDGNIQFRKDVYGYDTKITKALQKNSLLEVINSDKGQTILADVDNIQL